MDMGQTSDTNHAAPHGGQGCDVVGAGDRRGDSGAGADRLAAASGLQG